MKKTGTILLMGICLMWQSLTVAAQNQERAGASHFEQAKGMSRAERILKVFKDPASSQVLVAAHRGDWRSFPENSLEAYESAIAMGVDIIEIDVQKTKDGQLVIMHDKDVDRTTDGKGKISDLTLAEIKKLHLKNAIGRTTMYTVPTLEEVMVLAKDRVLVNLDKAYDYYREAYEILKRTGTVRQAIFKGEKTAEQVKKDFGPLLDEVIYMPILFLERKNAPQKLKDYSTILKPKAIECVFETDTTALLSQLKDLRKAGSRVWVNSLWESLCGGHNDDRAVKDPDANYGWILNLGANVIQCDRSAFLMEYLKKKGLRNF